MVLIFTLAASLAEGRTALQAAAKGRHASLVTCYLWKEQTSMRPLLEVEQRFKELLKEGSST